jgi:RNA polymerase sporulation-specific sigma factor
MRAEKVLLDEQEREEIANENIGYVYYFANKYRNFDREELVGAGMLGMAKALNSFDKGKGFKFITYAAKCINTEILFFIRQEKKHFGLLSIEYASSRDKEGNENKIIDTLTEPEREIDWREISGVVQKVFSKLKPRHKEIFILHIEGKNQREISEIIGGAQPAIGRAIQKIIQKIKLAYWEEKNENETGVTQ